MNAPDGSIAAQWILIGVAIMTAGFVGWQAWETRRAAKATALSVAAIDRQAGIMERQTAATEKAAEAAKVSADAAISTVAQMRETAERQLRAYVNVSSASLKFETPDVPVVQVHFRNFGQTPAYECHGWIGTQLGPHPLPWDTPSPDKSTLQMGKEEIAPCRISIYSIPHNPPIAGELLPLLGTARCTLYVFGAVFYKDAFGHDRCTNFRLLFGGRAETLPHKNAAGIPSGYLLNPDSKGNESS